MEDINPFCAVTDRPVLDVCPRYQSWGGSHRLHALPPMCNRILKFTSGATPAELLAASMATMPF